MQLIGILRIIFTFLLSMARSETTIRPEQQVSAAQGAYKVPICSANFTHNNLTVFMDTVIQSPLQIKIANYVNNLDNLSFHLKSNNTHSVNVDQQQQVINGHELDSVSGTWHGTLTINVHFIGKARIQVNMIDGIDNTTRTCENYLELIVVRKPRIIDHIFTGSVALLVSLLYVIFGAALDLNVLKNLLKRPAGPAIGFIAQFVLMPILSYGIGIWVFPGCTDMQLGLFFTGVSPSGGASNMWSVLLGGNINLSILMTTISNFGAFGMMPLWIFTLGSLIFARNHMSVPYKNIIIFAVSLIIPLAIGLTVQKCSQRMTRALIRLLKPASSCLILFIAIFAIVTNLYLFELLSWQIILGGLLLPWLGYAFAWLMAKICHQNAVDSLTIAIETSIQNTGIAIFLLRFSLPPPQDDLTTVIPVSVAIMTPIPLIGIYIYKRFFNTSSVILIKTEENSFNDDNTLNINTQIARPCLRKQHQVIYFKK